MNRNGLIKITVFLVTAYFLTVFHCTKREIISSVQVVLEPDQGMIMIPEGDFVMGQRSGRTIEDQRAGREIDADEIPDHRVYLNTYYIAQNPVTNRQYLEFWKAFDGGASSRYTPLPLGALKWPELVSRWPDHPVVGVSWDEAFAYASWKARRTGKKYRLPTEAEWEKAARGTDRRLFPWGDEFPDAGQKYRANFFQDPDPLDGYNLTSPVTFYNGINIRTMDSKGPYGNFDMAGNVWEWVSDWYSRFYYRQSPPMNPKGPFTEIQNQGKVIRGGSYRDDSFSIRTTNRRSNRTNTKNDDVGFRLAMDPE